MTKLSFTGTITSIQTRIRLTRSFDEVSHTYLGYAIKIAGTIDGEETISLNQNIAKDQAKILNQTTASNQTIFSIGIGKAAQVKFNFKVNDVISGECLSAPDLNMEPVDYYKISKLAKVAEGEQGSLSAP